MELSTRQKVEIEMEFLKEINNGMTREQVLANLIVSTFEIVAKTEEPTKKLMYIYEAYQMPIDEISKEIKKYDSSSPKLDAVKFVDDICERYNVDRKIVVQRIQNVRKINKYIREKNMMLKQKEEENNLIKRK